MPYIYRTAQQIADIASDLTSIRLMITQIQTALTTSPVLSGTQKYDFDFVDEYPLVPFVWEDNLIGIGYHFEVKEVYFSIRLIVWKVGPFFQAFLGFVEFFV